MEADKIRKLALARLGEHTPNERAGPCGGRTDWLSLRGSEGSFGESVLGEVDRTKLDLWRTLYITSCNKSLSHIMTHIKQ